QAVGPHVLHVEDHRRAAGQTQQPSGKTHGDRRVNAQDDVRLFCHQSGDDRHKRVTQVVDAALKTAGVGRDINIGAPEVDAVEVTAVKQPSAIFRRDFAPSVMRHAGYDRDFVTLLDQIGGQVGDQRACARKVGVKSHVQDHYSHQTFSTR